MNFFEFFFEFFPSSGHGLERANIQEARRLSFFVSRMAQVANDWLAVLDAARGKHEEPKTKLTIAESTALACLLLTRKSEKHQVLESLQSVRFIVSRKKIATTCAKYFDVVAVLNLFSRALNLDGLFLASKELFFDVDSDDVLGIAAMVFKKINQLLPTTTWAAHEKSIFHANMVLVLLRGYMQLSEKQVDCWYARLVQFSSWKFQVRQRVNMLLAEDGWFLIGFIL